MANTILRYVNQQGIPCIANISVSLTTTAETFIFPKYYNIRPNFQGLILININGTNSAPSNAVPINFIAGDNSNTVIPIYSKAGVAITTSTFSGDGIYLAFYDATANKLTLLNN